MTIIESVRDFIAECPYLEKLLRIHVDFLPARETAYSIEEMPVQTIVAQNVDGSTRRQFSFVFAAQLAYSDEARNNIDNSGFYESFADWLERCTAGGKLPTLPQGMTLELNGVTAPTSADASAWRCSTACRSRSIPSRARRASAIRSIWGFTSTASVARA